MYVSVCIFVKSLAVIDDKAALYILGYTILSLLQISDVVAVS